MARDPVDVLLLTLSRIGWSARSARYFQDDLGNELDLLHLSPALVARLPRDATQRWPDCASQDRSDLADKWVAPVFWHGIAQWLRRVKKDWGERRLSSLRALMSNTNWTQQRLYRHGKAQDDVCRLCRGAQGTLWHRHYECPAWDVFRGQNTSARSRRCAKYAREAGLAYGESFARAMVPDPACLIRKQPVPRKQEVNWINRPASGMLSGVIFSDGSARFPRCAALRRAGWALVQVDRFGAMISAAYGPVPFDVAPYQQARDGEDYAVHMSAWLVMPPFDIYVDCMGTLECLLGPPSYSTAATNERAHLWGPFWASFEPSDFRAHKTKAHTSLADVERGVTRHGERAANAAADQHAKLGAALHQLPEHDIWMYHALEFIAKEAAIWAGTLAAYKSDRDIRDADDVLAAAGAEIVHGHAPTDQDAVSVREQAPAAPAEERPIYAPVAGPLQINGHQLMAARIHPGSDSVIFCMSCGAYAVAKFRLLRHQCLGPRTPGLEKQRQCLRQRRFPGDRVGASIGRATTLTEEQFSLVRSRLGPFAAVSSPLGPGQLADTKRQISREQILLCFGLQGEGIQEAAAWAKAVVEKQRDKRQRQPGCSPGSEDEISDSFEEWGGV